MIFGRMEAAGILKLVLCVGFVWLSETKPSDCPAKCDCSDGNTVIDCSGQGLSSVPILPTTCKRVDLSNNLIPSISGSDFKNLHEVLFINLTANIIAKVDKDSFSDAKQLQHLYLGNNKLTQVPALAIKSLQTIILNGNLISDSPFIVFPRSWDVCINLTTVGLANNKFKKFQSTTFMNLKELPVKNVDLSNNKDLHDAPIDPSFFLFLPKLESINLSNNHLTAIDIRYAFMTIQNLSLLKTLNIAGTNIGKLDSEFFQGLTGLVDLNLSNSELSSWDVSTFTRTPKLMAIDLSHNAITIIHNSSYDNSFKGIEKSLKYAKLGGNPFHCYCSLMWLRELMDSKTLNILDKDDMTCAEPKSMNGVKVLKLSDENCVSDKTTLKPTTSTSHKPTTTTSHKPTTTTSHKPTTTTSHKPTTTTSHKPTTTTVAPNTTTITPNTTTVTPKTTTITPNTTTVTPKTTTITPNTTTITPKTTTVAPNTTTITPNTTTVAPKTTTSHSPITTSSSNSTVIPTTTVPPKTKAGFPGWGIALIVLVVLGLIVAGFFSYRHWRRRHTEDEGRLPIIGDPVA